MSGHAEEVRVAGAASEQPRETSGLTIRLIISYVRRHRGEAGVARLLQLADETRPLSVLEDERVWSSYDAKVALLEAASEVTGEPDVGVRVGRYVLDSSIAASLRLLLGLVSSPAALLRQVASVNSKFSGVSDMTTTAARTSATVTYRLRPGYRPSRFDCDYTGGMLSQAPVVFGLPPARVRHVACQSHGAEQCVYELRWQEGRWARRPWRRHHKLVDEHLVHQRVKDLQLAVTDLVGAADTDLTGVLSRIAERAAYAIDARRFLLVTRLEPDDAIRVDADGFDDATAAEIGRQLMAGEPLVADDEFIVAPVRSSARDYGRIAAFAAAPFFAPERDLLDAYAALAAASLDTLVARRDAEERRHTAEVLLRFAGRVALESGEDAVAQLTADALRELVGADAAAVLLLSPSGEPRTIAHSGFTPAEGGFLDRLSPAEEGPRHLSSLLLAPGSHVVLTPESHPELNRLLQAAGHDVAVGVGLHSPERAHGAAFAAWRAVDALPAADERLLLRLHGLAGQATTALDKSDLLAQVRRQADSDDLTGLANRRCFVQELESLLAGGSGPVGALLFLDLDGFKEVNDTLGHAAGDTLLRVVAERLVACVRGADVVARLGGDEFTVLLRGPHGEFAVREFAARVLGAFDEPIALGAGGPPVRARPSIGGVLVTGGGDADEALRRADDAMYRAKAAGGRRLVLADEDAA